MIMASFVTGWIFRWWWSASMDRDTFKLTLQLLEAARKTEESSYLIDLKLVELASAKEQHEKNAEELGLIRKELVEKSQSREPRKEDK
jgi:hypothetical protein